jgi:putative transposase
VGKQPMELKWLKSPLKNGPNFINIELICYTNLLRQTATRCKNARIIDAPSIKIKSSILDQFGIDEDNWLILTSHIEEEFSYVVGSVTYMEEYRKKLRQKKLKGISTALRLFK